MNKKMIIISLTFIMICLCFALFSDQIGGGIAKIISGEDGKCDYCGEKAGIGQGTKEYCGSCFEKYDGHIWD